MHYQVQNSDLMILPPCSAESAVCIFIDLKYHQRVVAADFSAALISIPGIDPDIAAGTCPGYARSFF